MNPLTIEQYLEELRRALSGCDAALIQDALNDAEAHLRGALVDVADDQRAAALPSIMERFGAPEEVAAAYRDADARVARVMTPLAGARRESRPWIARFFGVAIEPRTYGAVLYALLALVTGVFFFSFAVFGLALSLGTAILIFGIPITLGFLMAVRAISFVEGRLVEALLGERMPRRPQTMNPTGSLWHRIGWWLSDGRTWSSIAYMLLQLPLGVVYFTLMTTLLALSIGLIVAPVTAMIFPVHLELVFFELDVGWLGAIPLAFFGGMMLFVTLHLARGIGWLHSRLAKQMLVRV
ncbi:MAG: sensor domain-containing protein [Acidobacteriota bacterium]